MTSSTSRLTAVQLQQRLIYTQAEVKKLTKELERYKNDYHYRMIDELKAENEKLREDFAKLKEGFSDKQNEKNEATVPLQKNSSEQSKKDDPPLHLNGAQANDDAPLDESIFIPVKNQRRSESFHETTASTTNWFSRNLKARTKEK